MSVRDVLCLLVRRGLHAPLALLPLLALSPLAWADAGVLIPRDKQAPDFAILSLLEMRVDVRIDNGDAHVSIVQIFANHTGKIEEGTYRFALPAGSTVSDFAVWDGPIRIPAVILERKRAEQVYDTARLQAIDPGLLELGERDSADPRGSSVFTAKIVPIPAYGTKRLELDYHQRLPTTDFKQFFNLPLKPDAEGHQTVTTFHLHLRLDSAHNFAEFAASSKLLPLVLTENNPHAIEGSFDASNLNLTEDFTATWRLAADAADKLTVITHRDPHTPLPSAAEPIASSSAREKPVPEPGFFEAQLLVADPPPPAPVANAAATASARTFVLLFDNSLSMQWEKLERSYAALEATLRSLHPADRFNVLLFNQTVTPFKPEPVEATPAAIADSLSFIRGSTLRGGTDLGKALMAALQQSKAPATSLLLFTDGGSDRGEAVLPAKIAARYAALWKASPNHPHTVVFAVGDDANVPLLRNLSHADGFLEHVLSSEPIDFHLQSFLSKLTRSPVADLTLAASPSASTNLIYPLDDAVYPGSVAGWIGQYKPSPAPLTLSAHLVRGGAAFDAQATTPLPLSELLHPQLPRLWAQARVDALLAQIDRDGESSSAIDEIIRLSRRYKFVTPYTSFLAVPRSLLRPRVIRPGDPVLRVRTDPAIVSVIAVFPFGLTKPLRHLPGEDEASPARGSEDRASRLWETRFLAPPEMKDGTYKVRLLLRDSAGGTYDEGKTFIIASTPPTVKLQLAKGSFHRGETVEIRASASSSTRTLTAHLEGIAPVALHWNQRALTNTGTLVVPPDMPIGRYSLTLTGEDIAHNLGREEVQIDVIP